MNNIKSKHRQSDNFPSDCIRIRHLEDLLKYPDDFIKQSKHNSNYIFVNGDNHFSPIELLNNFFDTKYSEKTQIMAYNKVDFGLNYYYKVVEKGENIIYDFMDIKMRIRDKLGIDNIKNTDNHIASLVILSCLYPVNDGRKITNIKGDNYIIRWSDNLGGGLVIENYEHKYFFKVHNINAYYCPS